ncbi:MAG TPA: UDP-N-acetylmuramoyl-L-alanine--D-glutamate ligase [Rhizomicrobium sp.]|nr:UDP-N-acetylmuramoyl-L-alanine--D-glutamate ligase [Rhizomicrobium sp.]
MITVARFANMDVGVFGLARSGLASIRALTAGGARVYAWDQREAANAAGQAAGATIGSFRTWPWDKLRAVILSPGIPLTHPAPHEVVRAARDAGVEVIGDIELFAREIRSQPDRAGKAPIIAITGTNGKSTTTALIGHILSSCGFAAEIGGNIGRPVLELDLRNGKPIFVLEVSSYQIDLSPSLIPDVTVLTNITPDHIDRHGSMEGYVAVKRRLLKQTAPNGVICIGVDDQQSAAIYTQLSASADAETVPVSVGKVLGRGIFVLDGALYDAQRQHATKVMELSSARHLPGAHNWQNAALAYAAVKPYINDTRAIVSAIESFPGLAHRIEDVGQVGKVRFINDSKATNADAVARALVCFPDIYWIAGGKAKEGGIEPLRPHFGRIRKAYLIGDAASQFAATLEGVPHEIVHTLENAVAAASADAAKSPAPAPVVLLSPACASFDQFRDFEHRGDVFRALAAACVKDREAAQ